MRLVDRHAGMRRDESLVLRREQLAPDVVGGVEQRIGGLRCLRAGEEEGERGAEAGMVSSGWPFDPADGVAQTSPRAGAKTRHRLPLRLGPANGFARRTAAGAILFPPEALAQRWRISVPSTARHSRMKAASAVQPLADTIVPSTSASVGDRST